MMRGKKVNTQVHWKVLSSKNVCWRGGGILFKLQRGKLFTPCDFPRNVTNVVIKLREKFDIVSPKLEYLFAAFTLHASLWQRR